jgi:hypothetical protein
MTEQLKELIEKEIQSYANQYKIMREQGDAHRYNVTGEVLTFIERMTSNPEERLIYANMYYELRK